MRTIRHTGFAFGESNTSQTEKRKTAQPPTCPSWPFPSGTTPGLSSGSVGTIRCTAQAVARAAPGVTRKVVPDSPAPTRGWMIPVRAAVVTSTMPTQTSNRNMSAGERACRQTVHIDRSPPATLAYVHRLPSSQRTLTTLCAAVCLGHIPRASADSPAVRYSH